MRQYIISLAALMLGLSASSAVHTDSIATYKASAADSVIIRQNSEGVNVSVISSDANGQKEVTFVQPADNNITVKTRTRRTANALIYRSLPDKASCSDSKCSADPNSGYCHVSMGGINFGFNTAISSPQPMDVEMGKSFEIGILQALAFNYIFPGHRSSFSMGVGVNWRNYRMTTPVRFVPAEPGVAVGPYPEGVLPKSSRIKVFSVTIPLLYNLDIPYNSGKNYTGFYLGGILNLNTHASAQACWQNDKGNKVTESANNIGQRFFTVDIMGGIRLCRGVSIYAKYSPMKVLKQGSPQFSSFSTGILLGF